MMNIYVIEYDNKVSQEGYSTIDKAMEHLFKQGYKQIIGWRFEYKNSVALIKEIKIVQIMCFFKVS